MGTDLSAQVPDNTIITKLKSHEALGTLGTVMALWTHMTLGTLGPNKKIFRHNYQTMALALG